MTTTRAPWHVRAARKYGQSTVLYAALALSAPGEYALAEMAGWSKGVAWLMPAVMSLYAAIGASVADAQKKAYRAARGTDLEDEARRKYRSASTGALLALLMATAAQIAEHVLTTGATGARGWVVIIVSAVPPLVAAHVLHIDPPADDDELPNVSVVREAPAQTLQEPVSEPPVPPSDQLHAKPLSVQQEPHLVTYKDAAEVLGISDVTVRGAANDGRLKKYAGPVAGRVLVDLVEASSVLKSRRSVGV